MSLITNPSPPVIYHFPDVAVAFGREETALDRNKIEQAAVLDGGRVSRIPVQVADMGGHRVQVVVQREHSQVAEDTFSTLSNKTHWAALAPRLSEAFA